MPNKSEMIREIFNDCLKGEYIHPMKAMLILYESWLSDYPDKADIHEAMPDLIVQAWNETFTGEEIEMCYNYTKMINRKYEMMKRNLVMKIVAMCFSGPVNYDIPQ